MEQQETHRYRTVGSFFMMGGAGGGLSRNVGYYGWPTTKKKKKSWLKRPRAVPTNEIWTKV